jgi:hypothetical protein
VLGLAFSISLLNPIADTFGYALLWHTPDHISYRGREYRVDSQECVESSDLHIATSPRPIGSIFGWLTSSRSVYASTARRGAGAVHLVADCGDDLSFVVYSLHE